MIAHTILAQAVRRPAAPEPRRVSVGYTTRPEQVHCLERVIVAGPVAALAVILQDLALTPEALVAIEVTADGRRPALLLAPRGHTGRVVMIVREGLTFHELALALARLTPPKHDVEGRTLDGGDAA